MKKLLIHIIKSKIMKNLKEIKEAIIYLTPIIIVGGFIITVLVIGFIEQFMNL